MKPSAGLAATRSNPSGLTDFHGWTRPPRSHYDRSMSFGPADAVDLDRLRSVSGADPEIADGLISVFREEVERHLSALSKATEYRDIPAARDILHHLKGASANVGAQRLERLAREALETPHDLLTFETLDRLHRRLVFEFDRVDSSLRSWRANG